LIAIDSRKRLARASIYHTFDEPMISLLSFI
jgi:hypothetical protein